MSSSTNITLSTGAALAVTASAFLVGMVAGDVLSKLRKKKKDTNTNTTTRTFTTGPANLSLDISPEQFHEIRLTVQAREKAREEKAKSTATATVNDASLPLDISPAQFRALVEKAGEEGEAILKDTVVNGKATRIAGIDDPENHTESLDIRRKLHQPVPPSSGSSLASVLSEFRSALPCGMNHSHPGFMAFVGGPSVPSAGLGPLMDAVTNRFTGVWVAGPGVARLESNVVEWLVKLVGYDTAGSTRPSGVLLSGGSTANFTALVAARACLLPADADPRLATLYCSTQTHHCVAKGARCAGFVASDCVHDVPCDDRNRMRIPDLRAAIQADVDAGRKPFFIVANGGTTNTGDVDDIAGLAAVAKEFGLWLHVDGAYGAGFMLTEQGRTALAGIDLADSVSIDAHKSLFMPHGHAALVVKDESTLLRGFSDKGEAEYMPATELEGAQSACDLCMELSRPTRGLDMWFALKLHGMDAFAKALEEKLALAKWLHTRLRSVPYVKVLGGDAPTLSIVVFTFDDGVERDAKAANALTDALMRAINEPGHSFVSPTTVAGRVIIRACILQMRTAQPHVEKLAETVEAAAKAVKAGLE